VVFININNIYRFIYIAVVLSVLFSLGDASAMGRVVKFPFTDECLVKRSSVLLLPVNRVARALILLVTTMACHRQ